MKLQLKVVLAVLIGLIWIQQGFSDELSAESGINKWTCTCSASYQGNQSYIKSNCSTSCDCSPDGGQSGGMWTCTCSSDGLPKVATGIQDTTCFTACNCTSGSLTDVQDTRKHFSSKIVLVILLLCVILTTLAFLASITCYIYRKDKCLIQSPVFLSDRERSCNSATNLISHRASSVSETKIRVDSPINPISGCFRKASFLCRSKTEIIHGNLILFTYSELEHATNKFSHSNLIGLGGSSYVYRGQLKDGRTVAVKRLKAQGGPDADFLFSTEVELLAKLHHCHVVPLLGYCSKFQGKFSERLLVFEYMPNGNLRDCLDGVLGEKMNWQTRVTIAIGAARGLEYLHESAAPRILHRDVKSTNILMDENWRAKITDLGMAKRLRGDGVPSSPSSPARMQGTFGYFAPEYAMIGRASLMSDVFSFGVVLLELITGRQPIHKSTNKGEESLVLWATPLLQDSGLVLLELPDPRLKGNFPEEELQIMAYLAKECLLLDPDARPSMGEVVQILSTIAPEKSKRRNIPVNLFQMSSIQRMKTELFKEKPDSRAEGPVDAEEVLKPDRSIQQSALDVEHDLFVGSNNVGADNNSIKYMERLILLTSKAQSLRSSDDEAVDLTEPRLESFCMANVKSP
ncbi:receptor-like serine/threonine-protein kinase NCRK isoform X1 [Populus nigra]|uniref:receptor-like serine/threonine-protein kinase NCRK isoform X1 n=2 Tax=Populus nigra TaxID=3691 RepID=UPI002B272308|nr:receptor-like serine/threonine-protein kinase NCRK isoform X1 [Populus nigra]XP_061957698.1 receptor-like serine/threonine-protein kinase NCRK isoform X1 [Populus nigra]XP_061957699.1 receptor-like serine/threonine-protein kinase NCRK isoform X1 [Populus nigra]XP_061957700.1 receptor-like serine/threonine-protein kinase NCRK isoform X1 [Populus nigra]